MSRSPAIATRVNDAGRNAGPVPFSKSRVAIKTRGFSQADTRRPIQMEDQHGRGWSCQVENHSGMPTGLIVNNFSAPWLPGTEYLVVNPDDPSELWIDYRRMFLDHRAALSVFHTLAVQLASDKSWEIPKRGTYSQDIRRVLGNPPKPLEPVKAAIQGNPWILGFTDVVDPRLEEFVRPLDELDLDMEDGLDFGEDAYAEAVGETRTNAPTRQSAQKPIAAPAPTRRPQRVPVQPPVIDNLDDFDDEDDDPALAAETAEALADLPETGDPDPLAVLDQLESQFDPAAIGGRTIAPQATERAERQAPRAPGHTAPMSKRAESRGSAVNSARRGGKEGRGPSLADGAQPAISSAANANEYQRPEE